jgi:F-type H+-transporting ATPase subunit b
MPQLDFTTFPSQIFWLAVTFVLLYLLMAIVALPRLEKVMAARRERVDGDLDQAGQLKAESEAVIAAYEKALADARSAAQATMRETTERLAAEAAERQSRAAAAIAEKTAAAEARIAATKEKALSDLPAMASELAAAAASRLVGTGIDPSRAAAAVAAVNKGTL